MTYLLFFLPANVLMWITAMLLSSGAVAGELTPFIGASHFTPHADGIWYQEPFPHVLNINSVSGGVRYDTDKVLGDWSFGLGYMHLGKVSSSALAVALDGLIPNDGGYNSVTKACNGPCWPLSHWYGSGSVQGVFAAATWHRNDWALELGPYFYVPKWQVSIPDWIACRTCATQPILATHLARIQVGPMLGVKHRYGDYTVAASMWHTASEGDQWTSLYHNMTYNLSVGYSFH